MNTKTPENRLGFVGQVAALGGNVPNNPAAQALTGMKTGQGVFYGGKRVGELFNNPDKTVQIKFRNDNGYTGEETQLKPEEVQKYLGTTNSIANSGLYNELKSRVSSTASN
jgi:hypothetical protein